MKNQQIETSEEREMRLAREEAEKLAEERKRGSIFRKKVNK